MTSPLADAQARTRALDLNRHVLAMAPAGSGKTGLLVQRLLLALAQVDEPEQVVAITFTNKAAAEIRQRVITALNAAAANAPVASPHEEALRAAASAALARDQARGWQLQAQPARLRALTIDAFNTQIAAQMPLLSGLGGALAVTDDPQGLYAEAVTQLFAELEDRQLPDEDREALAAVLRLADNRLDRLLPALTDLLARREQWLPQLHRASAAEWAQAENAVLRAMVTARLEDLDAVLDRAEKQELRALLHEAAPHEPLLAWAASLEQWPAPEAGAATLYRQLASLLVTQAGTLRSPRGLNKRHGFPPGARHTQRIKAWLEGVQGRGALAVACCEILRCPDPEYPEPLRRLQGQVLRVLRRLAAHLRVLVGSRGEADFPELALGARAALVPDGGYSEALLSADRRIRHLLVDEMQDTSEGQVHLLQLLTQGWEPGDGHSLFLVGDPQQSIYAFRKAEVRLFLELWEQRRLGALPLDCVQLSTNFRSSAGLVDWFNRSFTAIFPPHSDPWSGVVRYAASTSVHSADEPPRVAWQLSETGDAEREGAQAAAVIQRLREQHPQDSIAVLARARSHLAPTLRALRGMGVAYACQDVDPLAALPAVRDYIQLARALWHPEDRLAWAVLLRAPFVGLSWADLVALSRGRIRWSWPARLAAAASAGLSEEGRSRVARLGAALSEVEQHPELGAQLADRAEALWHMLAGPATLSSTEYADVRAAMRLVRAHARTGELDDLERFNRALEALYGSPAAGAVDVLTIHKAKGLEFDHVVLVGCGRAAGQDDRPLLHLRGSAKGELLVPRPPPSLDAEDPARRLYDYLQHLQREGRRNELLRLLYVAATRAKSSLHLFVDLCRDAEDRRYARSGSFAELLLPVIPETAAASEAAAVVTPPAAVPRAPRLPLEYAPPAAAPVYRPRERRTLKPSEAVLHEGEGRQQSGDVYAQLVGSLLHQALQKAAEDGLEGWEDGGAGRRASLEAGLRRMGLPEPQVAGAATRVLELLARALGSTTGRWLLSPKPWARNEFQIAGYREGHWVAAVIDRCFEDEDGTLWIVDYKASARALPPEQHAHYVAEGMAEYAPQLAAYAELLGRLRPGYAVRAALYFVEADRLVEPATLRPAAA